LKDKAAAWRPFAFGAGDRRCKLPIMRLWTAITLICLVPILAMPARAQSEKDGSSPPSRQAPPASEAEQKEELLDRLFGRLRAAANQAEADVIEKSIWQLWMRSDSPTAELLLQQAMKAMNAKRYDKALDILDAVIDSTPKFSEALNKRATVYYLVGRLDQSLADIDRVLEQEPRHFGALAGLGMIRRDRGDDRGALEAFRQALAINPFLPRVRESAEDLEKQLEKGI
jgi:tetratricopeptide (TPR) repeat protein